MVVEVAGQRFQFFRTGLDYAFIPYGMQGVLALVVSAPSAHPLHTGVESVGL